MEEWDIRGGRIFAAVRRVDDKSECSSTERSAALSPTSSTALTFSRSREHVVARLGGGFEHRHRTDANGSEHGSRCHAE